MMRPRAKATKDPKFLLVFSQRSATRLKRLSLPTSCSMRARAVERLRKESGPVSGRGLERDHRADAPFARGRAIARAVVSFVPHRSPRRDVRPEVKQDLELRTVARLTLCEVESQRQAIEIGLEMDLGREAPAGAAQRLAILPPFGPCRRNVGAHHRGVEHLNQVRGAAGCSEGVEEGFEHA